MNTNNPTNERKADFISQVYMKYFDEVKRYFTARFQDEMRAEDMAQDLFIKLLDYEGMIVEATAQNFVFTIARRMMIDEARHQQFVRQAAAGYKLQQEQNRFWQDSESLECKQLAEMEQAKLRALPHRMAHVYRLTRFEGKTAQELADELQISKRTVEYHLLVARREIRTAVRRAMGA